MALAIDWKNALRMLLLVVGLGVGQAFLNVSLRGLEGTWIEPPADQGGKWNPKLFETMTFGHLPAAIDMIWMRTLMDPAISHVPEGQHPALYYDLDLATDLDPAFFELYYFGGNLLSVVRDDAVGARDLLLKGKWFQKHALEQYPMDFRYTYWSQGWSLYTLLAYVYLFEMDDIQSASSAFLEAAAVPNSPDYLRRLRSRLEKPDGMYEVGMKLINFMIESARDDREKERLERRRNSLYLSQFLFNLNSGFMDYLRMQPSYRAKASVKPEELRKFWTRYRKEQKIPEHDPWGGTISLDENGKVVSSTPRNKVFGLE